MEKKVLTKDLNIYFLQVQETNSSFKIDFEARFPWMSVDLVTNRIRKTWTEFKPTQGHQTNWVSILRSVLVKFNKT